MYGSPGSLVGAVTTDQMNPVIIPVYITRVFQMNCQTGNRENRTVNTRYSFDAVVDGFLIGLAYIASPRALTLTSCHLRSEQFLTVIFGSKSYLDTHSTHKSVKITHWVS